MTLICIIHVHMCELVCMCLIVVEKLRQFRNPSQGWLKLTISGRALTITLLLFYMHCTVKLIVCEVKTAVLE